MKTWTFCMTKAQQHFNKASEAGLLKDWKTFHMELCKSHQWLSEAGMIVATEEK